MSTSSASSPESGPEAHRLPPGFNKFYNEHHPMLRQWLVKNGNDAGGYQEEISNDAFMILYRKWNTLPPKARKAFLYKTAFNRARDYRKKAHSREKATDFKAEENYYLHSQINKSHPLEERVLFHQALSSFPTRQAQAILLCTCYKFTIKEAAEILGIGFESVKSALADARKKFPALREEVQG